MRYYVAFYRGRGTVADRIVRYATRSPFSHCELIHTDVTPRRGDTVRCVSASGRDKGVRIKEITLTPAKWDIYAVPWAPDDAWDRAVAHVGKPYELWSMVLSQLFNFRRQDRGKWFCSELIAYALGLNMPHAKSPGDLLRDIDDHTDTYKLVLERVAAARRPDTAEEDDEDLSPAT
ncbi:hypothetical protein JANAI62_33450 [Jannaschia pagri]|uniref:Permuted papain-like amidase enzyme, YaeF/YiiX, C92 family n=1 Tax=Jannaschia pagri TaxID=2829797 RepID=A0ABQ4NQR3_9RHOB|nr:MULTISPECIES: hypothetical protein [unclassified Jannaschia]GIT92887.1 hypothetical protein JANAI61_33450 [Jannaschia sp. AI_61]GIT96722.1 hypothetical protein JANAI62_33450 [Jannaschia sp. AI_62]